MKYEVKRIFKSKPSNKRYHVGSIFETSNNELAEQLKNNGFLGKKIDPVKIVSPPDEASKDDQEKPEQEKSPAREAQEGDQAETPPANNEEQQAGQEQADIVDLGYGWYQLPDGRKVRKSQIDGEN